MPPELATLQRRFWELITGDGVGELQGWVAGPDRMQVYARMYLGRLQEVVRGDYPRLSQLLGDNRMERLVADYLRAHPSDHPSVRHVGRHLPLFLRGHALMRELPVAADLAALEWVRGLSFDGPDALALQAGALAGLAPQDWPLLRLVPSAFLLPLRHPAHEVWLALERDQPPPGVDPRPVTLAVWRAGFAVWHRPLEADEAVLLEHVQKGVSLIALCEGVAGPPEEAAHRVFALIQRWVDEGLLLSP